MEPLTQSADAAAPPDGPPAALVQALWRHRFARILAEMTAGVDAAGARRTELLS